MTTTFNTGLAILLTDYTGGPQPRVQIIRAEQDILGRVGDTLIWLRHPTKAEYDMVVPALKCSENPRIFFYPDLSTSFTSGTLPMEKLLMGEHY